MARSFVRWAVPVGVALAVAGVGGATTALRAAAQPELPERSAAQLLVDLQTARLEALSGTVVLRADLGLPALPGMAGSGQLGALLNGFHTLRVWYSGPDKVRLALLGTLGESDIIRNGQDLWIWSSKEQSATHHKLPPGLSMPDGPLLDPNRLPATPQELADRVLAALDPSTVVSTAANTTIAGRSAYELVLAPRDEASLVRQVRVAVDGERHLPLRVQVLAKGHPTPAFEVGFRQVSFARPGEEHFRFTPPPGTRVEEGGLPGGGAMPHKPVPPGGAGAPAQPDKPVRPGEAGAPAFPDKPALPELPGKPRDPDRTGLQPRVVGEAWTAVLVARVPTAGGTGDLPFGVLLNSLPTVKGDWGSGRLLRSRLLTALLTDDGRLLVGAVTPERLYEAAAAGG
ncbi:MAG TPA: hypothetical protein VFB84_11005 [Micromonosporaceae bacterium]|nr:hypothetical protein [Micromonosporaceae bacterium]